MEITMKYLLMLMMLLSLPLKASEIQIFTPEGPVKFQVELAISQEEQGRGLMYRHTLQEKTGMLFINSPQNPLTMWMKNTPLSLDMIFINPQGIIIHIEESTIPYSTHIIGPVKNAMGIFEVLAGTCRKKDIKVGDKVSFELFQ